MNLLIFYIFSGLLIASSLAVISMRNPVYSVLFLILCFFCSAALFLLQGAEFLAMLLVIIYVGAVAVLFLFVVMMLNIDFKKNRKSYIKELIIGSLVAAILFIEISLAISEISILPTYNISYPIEEGVENIKQIGEIIYTKLYFHLQIAGITLLVSMIGAVMLTHRIRENVRKQNISSQVLRTREESVKLVKVLSRKGI